MLQGPPFVRQRPRKSRKIPAKGHVGSFIAPIDGIDRLQPIAGSNPRTAVICENFISRPVGLELRAGYARHASGIPDIPNTLLPYMSTDPTTHAPPKLFVASENKFYNVTTPVSSPTAAFTTTNPPLVPGQWSSTNFTTLNKGYLCAVAEGAGYVTYNHADGWVEHPMGPGSGTTIDGVDPRKFDQVISWKERLWFVEAGSTNAWYLPTRQISGVVQKYDFGPTFIKGGELAALMSWSYDGGTGLDDLLVAVSTEGDISIYQGTDPNSVDTFGIVNKFNLGRVPKGRRFFCEYGGDLLVISTQGVSFLTQLLRGEGLVERQKNARRVAHVIGEEVKANLYGVPYWEPVYYPEYDLIVINAPDATPQSKQWIMSTLTERWSTFSNVPIRTHAKFGSNTYFTTEAGTVEHLFDGDNDGSTSTVAGAPVVGWVLTVFAHMGSPANLKTAQLLQATFASQSVPSFQAQINTEWTLSSPPGSPPFVPPDTALWDSAKWDVAIWAGERNTYRKWVGAVGTGTYFALSLKLRGEAGTLFTNWDVVYTKGGIM